MFICNDAVKYHENIIMLVISVSKTYKHRGKNIKHREKTRKFWQIMYYDYDEEGNLKLYSTFVNPILALYYKLNKYYKRKFYCPTCEIFVEILVKKNTKRVQCPFCLTE